MPLSNDDRRVHVFVIGEILTATKTAIVLSNDLGRNAFVVDEDDVIHLLRAAVKREGSQIAYADHYGVDRAIISAVLSGRRRI